MQLPSKEVVAQGREITGRDVRDDGDDAVPARRQRRQREHVVARQDREGKTLTPLLDLGHAHHASARLLDADDSGNSRKAADRLRQQIDAGAARHVVEDDRQTAARGDGLEVAEEAFLRRLVVVRRDD